MKKVTHPDHYYSKRLRRRAEEFINKNPSTIKKTPPRDVKNLVEDLQIHQVELEMQNEDLRQAQLELKAARDRYSALFDFAPVGYFTISDKGIIQEANLTGASLLKIRMGHLIGSPFSDFIFKEDQDIFYLHRQKLLKSKISRSCELRLVRKDGSKFHAHMDCIITADHDDNPVRIRATVTDITERKQAEKRERRLESQLRQAQKMESIGTLAGGIAHNFNNILAGIVGAVELVIMDIDEAHPNYRRLQDVKVNVQRGAKLTSQLLGYDREGRHEVKPVGLNRLLEQTAEAFGEARKEISVHQDLDENLYEIEAGQGQIEKVLLSLFVNAADAMPEGGGLFLKTKNVTNKEMRNELFEPEHGNHVLLTVKDTGTGMDKQTRERIFDPFFTTKKGTGLGLTSAYGIIKGHGGHLEVDSEEGMGTTFSIYLPATNKEVTEKHKTFSGELLKGEETILLVDDEQMVLHTSSHILKRLGYDVLSTESGQEALERYKKNRDKIDLVILDMVMPGMGGGETFDRIRQINPHGKVLLSSGYDIDGEAKAILGRGCEGFIQKPFSLEEISQKIREVLDGPDARC